MWLIFSFFGFFQFINALAIGSQCLYSFQCAKNSFCFENVCRRINCNINSDCSKGELCVNGRVDGVAQQACFPIDASKAEKLNLCPGGGKPVFDYKKQIETCDILKECSGRGLCNPAFGVCCSKLRTCLHPNSPLLEGFTHKPLICHFRGIPATPCPLPSFCEIQSGFCCTNVDSIKKPSESKPQPVFPIVNPPKASQEKPFVGENCRTQIGCSGGAVCVCSKPMTNCVCTCPKEMGYTVAADGKTCKRTRRRLKEKCRSDMECQSAFSECTSGGCRCKSGFQRDGNGGCKPVTHKCVNHAEPLKFDNQIMSCVVQRIHRNFDENSKVSNISNIFYSPTKDKSCPSHYYCVPVFDVPKKPNLYQGFCCPLPQPDIPVCPVGNPHISSSSPDYGCSECPMDHYCHQDSVATKKEICCPKPCISPEDVYVDNQCYPIAYHGDSCTVSQQCVGKFAPRSVESIHEELNEMECVKGICECPKGFLNDNGYCKRVQCTIGLKSEPIVNSLGGILKCTRSSDCSQGSMCDPFSKVCCKGINKCPSNFVETGEICKNDKCRYSNDICIVPKNSKSKICCRKEN